MMVRISCSDAQDYIRQMEDESIDLLILDPDYQDWHLLLQTDFLGQCLRILKSTGNILCFTKQPFDYELRVAVNSIMRREIIWTFTNGGAWVSNKMPLVSFQKIYWCVKSSEFYFNPRTGQDYSEKTKDFKRTAKVFGDWKLDGQDFEKSDDGIWIRDHLHYNKPQAGKIPAKPQELIRTLVTCFCPVGGIIFDPFAGTGTVAKVAEASDRDCICTEIDPERYEAIKDYFGLFAIGG